MQRNRLAVCTARHLCKAGSCIWLDVANTHTRHGSMCMHLPASLYMPIMSYIAYKYVCCSMHVVVIELWEYVHISPCAIVHASHGLHSLQIQMFHADMPVMSYIAYNYRCCHGCMPQCLVSTYLECIHLF